MDKHFIRLARLAADITEDKENIFNFITSGDDPNKVLFYYERLLIKGDTMAEIHEKMKDNIFNYDGQYTLAFCDLTGAMSGELMKAIGFRNPKIIDLLKIEIKKAQIGSIIFIQNYIFVVVRKHYANKVTAATIAPMIAHIAAMTANLKLKVFSGDFPQFKDEINKLPNITWYSKCDWPWSN